MIKMTTANKARAKTEFARSVGEYIESFNEAIEYRTSLGEDHMTVQKEPRMNIGQWNMFIDMIEDAGYRIVKDDNITIGVYW